MKKYRVIPNHDAPEHWMIVEEVQINSEHPFDTVVCADTIKKGDVVDNTGALVLEDPGKAAHSSTDEMITQFTSDVEFVQNYLTIDTQELANLQSYRANTLIDIAYWENPTAEKAKGIAKPDANPELEGLSTDAEKLTYFQNKLSMWDNEIDMKQHCIASDREELKTVQDKLNAWIAIRDHERALANT
jgi:hypothetical protein